MLFWESVRASARVFVSAMEKCQIKKKKKEEKLLILFSDTLLLVKVAEDFNMHAGSLVNEAWRWEVE